MISGVIEVDKFVEIRLISIAKFGDDPQASRKLNVKFKIINLWSMPECEFFLTCIFTYKDRIYDSVLIWENMGQTISEFWYILQSAFHSQKVYWLGSSTRFDKFFYVCN